MERLQPWMFNLKRLEQMAPSLRYEGEGSFEDWQQAAKAKLAELLGMQNIHKPENGAFQIEYVKEGETFTEYRFLVESEEDYFVPCVMLVPNTAQAPAPTVLCLQGHSTGMHISLGRPIYEGDEGMIREGDRDFAIRAVKEGCIAVAIEQRNFGECGANANGNPSCHVSSMSAIISGRTTMGERVHDVSCVIDALLANFPVVDPQRLILLGNSGGATTTVYTAALDSRIHTAVPSCAVCTFKASIAAMPHCVCNFIPNIAKYFDMGDICSLVAPRNLIIVNGKEDEEFPDHGVREAFSVAAKVYSAAGVPERCRLVTGQYGHRFYAEETWPHIRELAEL